MNWSAGAESHILVLTCGAQRVLAINGFASAERLRLVARLLPTSGGAAPPILAALIASHVNARP